MTEAALVLVATPIGNLSELSPRAVEALAAADLIACEDTRRTGRLLEHAGIAKPKLLVVNDHTESAATRRVLAELDAGRMVAVVTDAGMPGISDPGERLVRAAVSAGHRVSVVAGPNPSTFPIDVIQTPVAGTNDTQWIVTFHTGIGTNAINGGTGTVIKDGLYLFTTIGSRVHAESPRGSRPTSAA